MILLNIGGWGGGPVGIEKTISVQKVFSKSCYLWSMLPEKPRLTSGFHKKVFMKRPTGHKGPLGRRCPALESLRDASVDSSLNASPDKGGEREVSCWNCEAPLTPTHQCEEVVDDSEGKDCDEGEWTEGCFYNPDSDPCGQCPSCLQKGTNNHP